ncbi:alpha/beta hydrolase [Acinetobacter tandoii]|nr:alpha/beta hydrolase [Acinetobacter tandoii]
MQQKITPPSQEDWVNSKKYLKINDQVEMAYVEWGNPSGEPIFLIHGYSDSSRAYSTVAPLLQGARFIAPDLRGHGNTTAPNGAYGIQCLAEDISDFIDALGYKRAKVVGHSMGSLTAGLLASFYPEKVEKLILISSAVKMNPDVSKWLYEQIVTFAYPTDPNNGWLEREWAGNPNGIFDDVMMKLLRKEQAAMPQRVWASLLKAMDTLDWSHAARHITAPTLIMWGDQDTLMTEAEQGPLCQAIPHAIFKRYEGKGHSMYWEDPQEGANDIMDFLMASNL